MLLQAHWTEPVWRPRVTYLDVGSKDRTSAEAILRKAPPSAAGLFDGRLVPTSERVPVGRTERRAARVAQYHLSRTISSQRTQYHPNVYGFSSSSARQARAWLAAE
jgi:hypothetical protein